MSLRLQGKQSDGNTSSAACTILGGPRPPGSGWREIAPSGMPSRISLTGLVISTSDPFTHASREHGGEKTVALFFARFHG